MDKNHTEQLIYDLRSGATELSNSAGRLNGIPELSGVLYRLGSKLNAIASNVQAAYHTEGYAILEGRSELARAMKLLFDRDLRFVPAGPTILKDNEDIAAKLATAWLVREQHLLGASAEEIEQRNREDFVGSAPGDDPLFKRVHRGMCLNYDGTKMEYALTVQYTPTDREIMVPEDLKSLEEFYVDWQAFLGRYAETSIDPDEIDILTIPYPENFTLPDVVSSMQVTINSVKFDVAFHRSWTDHTVSNLTGEIRIDAKRTDPKNNWTRTSRTYKHWGDIPPFFRLVIIKRLKESFDVHLAEFQRRQDEPDDDYYD